MLRRSIVSYQNLPLGGDLAPLPRGLAPLAVTRGLPAAAPYLGLEAPKRGLWLPEAPGLGLPEAPGLPEGEAEPIDPVLCRMLALRLAWF